MLSFAKHKFLIWIYVFVLIFYLIALLVFHLGLGFPLREKKIFLHLLLEVVLSYLLDLDLETTDWEYPTPAPFTSCNFSTTFQFGTIHVAAEAMTV